MDFEKIKKINLKHKIIISIATILLIIGGIVYLIVCPAVRDIKRFRDEIYAQKLDLEEKYQKGQSLRSLSEKIDQIKEQENVLDQAFIKKGEDLKFVTSLENIASQNNIVQKIDINPPTDFSGKEFQTVPLKLFTQGRLRNQLKYLISLERLGYYINIYSLSISSASSKDIQSAGEETLGNQVSLMILANTFWKK